MAARGALVAVACSIGAAQTLPQLIAANSDTQILALLLTNNGLNPTLSGASNFTVFGPNDAAFLSLGPNVNDFLQNGFNAAQNNIVLTYHVVAGSQYTSSFVNNEVIPTLDTNESITISVIGPQVSVDTARIVDGNLNATNGVLHVIDGLLVPKNVIGLPKQDIVSWISLDGNLSSLLSALVTGGLVSSLQCTPQLCSPFTVFAPNNDAFAALPPYFLSYLASHPAQLAEVLQYHILDHRVYSPQIRNNLQVNTLDGYSLVFVVEFGTYGTIYVNGVATVTSPDNQAANGAVHIIDTVLIPNNIKAAFEAWLVEKNKQPKLPAPRSLGVATADATATATATSSATATATATPTATTQTLASWVESTPQLSALWNAVYTSGIIKLILEGPGPLTLLAPTNEAFGLLPDTYVAYLLAHPTTALSQVLAYNILPYTLLAANVSNGTEYTTEEGQTIEGFVNANGTFFNDAQVVAADNFLANGVAHATAAVLLPIATDTPSASPTQTATPSQQPSGPARRRG